MQGQDGERKMYWQRGGLEGEEQISLVGSHVHKLRVDLCCDNTFLNFRLSFLLFSGFTWIVTLSCCWMFLLSLDLDFGLLVDWKTRSSEIICIKYVLCCHYLKAKYC